MVRYSGGLPISSNVLLALLCLMPISAFAEPPVPDPIEWNEPASPPEFRALLSDEEYQKRFQSAWQEIGTLADLESSTTPVAGTKIILVTPGSQADLLGIRVGDSVTHCNDEILWKRDQLGYDRDDEREIRVVSPKGEMRNLPLEPGTIGIDMRDFWHPELQYVRNGNRDPRWDREVVVGLLMAERDPKLAETCWARAIAAGYPRDDVSATGGAVIAMNSGRVAVAADFAFDCLDIDRDDNEAVHPHLLFRIALANYKLKGALQIIKQQPTCFSPENVPALKGLISLHEARSAEERCLPAPSQLSKQMYHDDFRQRAVPLGDHPSVKTHVDQLRSSPTSNLSAPTAHFALATFGPPMPVKNVDLQVRFRLQPTDNETSGFLKIFECGLMDVEHWTDPERMQRGSETFLFAGLQDDGTIRTTGGGLPTSEFIRLRATEGAEQEQALRLVRVGGQAEVFINGTRIIYAPVYDDVDFVSVLLKSVGMNVEILDLAAVELIERL